MIYKRIKEQENGKGERKRTPIPYPGHEVSLSTILWLKDIVHLRMKTSVDSKKYV